MALQLVIVTPEGEAYSGEVEQAVLPGSEGDFGVLARHERFLAPLKHGALEIKTSEGTTWAAVSNGFADVGAEKVVVLADYCALADEIDVAMVKEEHQEAEAELAALPDVGQEQARRLELEEVLVKARIRLQVAEKR